MEQVVGLEGSAAALVAKMREALEAALNNPDDGEFPDQVEVVGKMGHPDGTTSRLTLKLELAVE